MDGVRERNKHIGRDVERMRDRYLERDRGYLEIYGRELGGIERNIYMHEKKGTLKTFLLYVTIQKNCFLLILCTSLDVNLTYLLCLNILRAWFYSPYHVCVFPLYNACAFCECINSGLSLSDNKFTL